MNKEKNEIKIGAVLSYVIILINMVVGIVFTPIITRILGQSEYGLYTLVSSVISYLTILDFGFGNAIIIYTSKYKAKGEKEKEQKLHGMFFIIYAIIGLVACILGLTLTCNIENLFGNTMNLEEINKAKVMMLVLTGNLAISFPLSIFTSIISSYEKFLYQKIINIIRLILQPLVMLVLLKYGYRSIALVILISIFNIITLLLNAYYCKKKLDIKLKIGKIDFKLLKEISAYSIWIFINMIIDKINWSLDELILGMVSGTIAVSKYSIGCKLDQMYMSFSTAINSVLLPRISKMEAKQASDEEFSKIFIKTGRIQYIILAFIMSGFIIYGREFINIMWVGSEYDLSYFVALLIMIPSTFSLIQNVGLNILQAKNKYKYRVIVLSIFAVFNVIFSIFLSKYYGAIGAAIGTGVSLLLGNVIFMNVFYYRYIHLDIPKFWKEIIIMTIPIFINCIIMFMIKQIWNINNSMILISQIIIYCILYVLSVYKFSLNQYEKDLFVTPIRKIVYEVRKRVIQ